MKIAKVAQNFMKKIGIMENAVPDTSNHAGFSESAEGKDFVEFKEWMNTHDPDK